MALRIGELCVNSGLVSEKQVAYALELQKQSKKKLGEIMIELGFIKIEELNLMLSVQRVKPGQ